MHAGNAEKVELEPPDIPAYRAGNTSIPYVTSFDSGRPGPHAAIVASCMATRYRVRWRWTTSCVAM